MNSFGPLEQIGDETTTTGMKHRIREAAAEEAEAAALKEASANQRSRALPPPSKYSERESAELEKDGFKVVKSRSTKKAPTEEALEPPPNVAVHETDPTADEEAPQQGRGKVFWLLTVAAVSCVALICGKALMK